MAETRIIQNSPTTRRNIRVLDRVQTTDATPTVAYSIPLGQGRVSFIQAKVIAVQSDFSHAQSLDIQAGFRRASGGNVTKSTPANNRGFLISSGDFTGTSPDIDIVANTGNQTIDVQITGKAATTINWYLELLSIQNLD
jgi:hypothetical protein